MSQVGTAMETIYQRPGDYDLEHEGDDEDVAFYVRLLEEWRPRRVMELASGSGRVTIPLARAAARSGVQVVADLSMPNLAVYADSMQTPPRAFVEIDVDARDPQTGTRLLRYKTTRYLPHEQRAEIRFLYDRFPDGDRPDRYVSDFDCHVYYPREVELLFRAAGFSMERWFGDYVPRRLRATSRQMIAVGRKPAE